MIGIINYGSGNINAIANIYNREGVPFRIISDSSELSLVDKLILPGVGSYDATIKVLNNSGLKNALDIEVLEKKKPVLGICVGMQIMGMGSEEGELCGLGWIKGHVRKFDITKIKRKPYLPHMGWNSIELSHPHSLFEDIDHDLGFYFVHSYFFEADSESNVLAKTNYSGLFPSVIWKDQIFGVQFHPEKSHSNGIKLLSNFAKI